MFEMSQCVFSRLDVFYKCELCYLFIMVKLIMFSVSLVFHFEFHRHLIMFHINCSSFGPALPKTST